jgi:hypothetical protein
VDAAPPPAAWLGASALVPQLEGDASGGGARGGAPASDARLGSSDTLMPVPSYTGTDGTGQMLAQGLDWSWPPMPAEDMAMAEIAFDKQMNVPRGGWLWMGRFMDFLEVVDGVPKSAIPGLYPQPTLRVLTAFSRLAAAVEAEAVADTEFETILVAGPEF